MLNVTDHYCISPATSKGGFSCHPGDLSRKCHLCHGTKKLRWPHKLNKKNPLTSTEFWIQNLWFRPTLARTCSLDTDAQSDWLFNKQKYNILDSCCFLASHADVLRGSSHVPVGRERVTNPQKRLRARLVFISFKKGFGCMRSQPKRASGRTQSVVQILNEILLVNLLR